MMILCKRRLLRRAQLKGVSKGGEHPLWSRTGFKPCSRIQLTSHRPYPEVGAGSIGAVPISRRCFRMYNSRLQTSNEIVVGQPRG